MRPIKMTLIAVIALLCVYSTALAQSPLASLAGSMQAGAWAELSTANIGALTQAGTDGNILTYAADAAFDQTACKLYYVGNDHIDGNIGQTLRFVSYDCATNTWTNLPTPPWAVAGKTDHGYYHHAVDAQGSVYRRATPFNGVFDKYSNGAWTALPAAATETGYACCGTVDYFPELGGLVFAQGGELGTLAGQSAGSVYLFTLATQQWSKLADNIVPLANSVSTVGAYNPVHKVFVFGQDGAWYKLAADRSITKLNNPPITIYSGSGHLINFIADPITGKYVVLTQVDRQLYTYDAVSDIWAVQSSVNKPNLAGHSVVSVAIPQYGVIMYPECYISTCKVWLYKTSGTVIPVPTPTPAPTPVPSPLDFATRCAATGVVKCVGFDALTEITGDWGINPQGRIVGSPSTSIDTTTKVSGTGSLRLVAPSGTPGGTGSVFVNFSNDYSVQFGENTEFYVQYRWRADSGYMAALPTVGMKQDIIGTGSTSAKPYASCTDLEFVTQNSNAKQVPQFYQNCGRYEPFNVGPLPSPYTSSDFLIQPAQGPSPGCWWGAPSLAQRVPPTGSCVPYAGNEWMTIQKHVKVGQLAPINGQWWFTNSYLDAWVAREGQSPVQVLKAGPYNIGPLSDPAEKYGQIWLLMYSGGGIYPQTATTWYDDLIISTQPIAMNVDTVPAPSPVPQPVDTIPPTVTFTNISNGGSFSSNQPRFNVRMLDNYPANVVRAELWIDDYQTPVDILNPQITRLPDDVAFYWRTRGIPSGTIHILKVVACDSSGNCGQAQVSVRRQ